MAKGPVKKGAARSTTAAAPRARASDKAPPKKPAAKVKARDLSAEGARLDQPSGKETPASDLLEKMKLEIDQRKQIRLAMQAAAFPLSELAPLKRRGGRQPGTPDTWTDEHVLEVAEDLANYIDTSDFPTEAEFCYTRGVHSQRFSEIPLFRQLRDLMQAKRQAITIRRGLTLEQGESPLGSFLQVLAANAGAFSMTGKSDVALHSDEGTMLLPPEEREARIAALLEKARGGK